MHSTDQARTVAFGHVGLHVSDIERSIRFYRDVLGFEEQIVVPNADDETVIEHSQLHWPEGGVVQAHTANREGRHLPHRRNYS